MEDNTTTKTNKNKDNNNNDSVINGLKFGQKIYFEDSTSSSGTTTGNNRGPTSSNVVGRSSGSNNNTSSSGGGGGRRGVHGGGQQQNVPRCQVEGCQVDLSDAKAYYSRHKVCCMHSKSPKVVVCGLEQRFCQQCSRFHQLSEFDQGKRSCRRRLAGHNERRRKPQPGSMFSRFGRVPTTIFDNSGQTGGFLLDFTAPTRLGERDAWPHSRPFELVPGNESAGTGSSFSHSWQSNSHNSSTNLYLQGSSCGTGFSSSRVLPGECFTGVAITDSTCALSLLSNQQPWGSRNSSLGANNMANAEATSMAHPTGPHGMPLNQYPNPAWGFKASDETSNELCPDLGLAQISQPLNTQFPGDPEMSQQSRRQYSEMEPTRAYDPSNQNMHWSL